MTVLLNTTINSTVGLDLFTTKFNTDGDYLWSKAATGITSEYGNEIVNTSNGNVAVIGKRKS